MEHFHSNLAKSKIDYNVAEIFWKAYHSPIVINGTNAFELLQTTWLGGTGRWKLTSPNTKRPETAKLHKLLDINLDLKFEILEHCKLFGGENSLKIEDFLLYSEGFSLHVCQG